MGYLVSRRIAGVLGLAVISFAPLISNAQDKPFVAVFSMEDRGSGLSPQAIGNLTDYLSAKLVECGYQVIPQDQIKNRLRQQKQESFKSCYDQSCQIELGRELSAQKSLSTKILKIGGTCQVTATLYDLLKSAAENAATGGGKCREEALLLTIDSIVVKLCQPLVAMKRESAKAVSDFDRVLKEAESIKEKKERVEKAWDAVYKMSNNTQIPRGTRADLLQKFLTEFATENPHDSEARKLLAGILPGILVVRTSPPGATVTIDERAAGNAPFTLEIMADKYVVRASMVGFETKEQEVTILSGKRMEVSFTLQNTAKRVEASDNVEAPAGNQPGITKVFGNKPQIPTSSNVKWGHIAFWSGLGFSGFGVVAAVLAKQAAKDEINGDIAAGDRSRTWAGMMYAGLGTGAVLMISGIILWLSEPASGAGDQKEGTTAVVLPINDGLSFSLSWRW